MVSSASTKATLAGISSGGGGGEHSCGPLRCRFRMGSGFLLTCVVGLPLLFCPTAISASEFNFEISQRVHEKISRYMNDPRSIARIISEYRSNGGFPHDMAAPDRSAYLRLNEAVLTQYPHFESVYYGLEDGVFVGHGFGNRIANYREPGESGYVIDEETGSPLNNDMAKHYTSCVDDAGGQEDCKMAAGGPYVECINDCALARCPDEDSQRDCIGETSSDAERAECEATVKWCRQYVRKAAPDTSPPTLGYVPRNTYCIAETGVASQTPGEIAKKDTDVLGSCYYKDGTTMVNRSLSGDFAYCGGDGAVCSDTFVGAYQDRDYDPRWRGWYEGTRALQTRNWSPPYPFFSTLAMGITYCEPIYSLNDEGRNVFEGIVAVDYTFDNITEFLVENYQDLSVEVAVFEEAPPHYLIASSTGSKGVRKALASDESQPCPEEESAECTAVRVGIEDMSDNEMDVVLARAFARQAEENFPEANLVAIKAGDNTDAKAYASQTQIFNVPDAGLAWRVIIISPAQLSSEDAILPGNNLFPLLVAVGIIGAVVCLFLLFKFFKYRATRAVVASDWRFTGAFIWGCAMLNTASLSFLGPNTNSLCLLRMWMFHLFFAVSLSPLLVKTYRMMILVGGNHLQRVKISHKKAFLMTLPIVLFQVLILLIFSFVDPSKQKENIEMSGGSVEQRITCSHDTNALFIVEMLFEGGLVLAGCVLAFKTRNLHSDFGEAKQLILAMYNIAVVGSVVVIVTNVMTTGQASKRVLIAIGILWGSVFSSCAFVIPRLLQVRDNRDARSGTDMSKGARRARPKSNVHVSGLGNSILPSSNSSASQVRFSKKYGASADSDEEMMNRIEEEIFAEEGEANGNST
jgi:hypothetical protein